MEAKPIVTVTGASGFLGSHVIKCFLDSRRYKVRGTVRSEEKRQKVIVAFRDHWERDLEVVLADLTDEQSLAQAVRGASFVVHTANPMIQLNQRQEESHFVEPAVNGTLAILRACVEFKVKRVVITSSTAAITEVARDQRPEVFDEDCWSDPERPGGIQPYQKSKVLMERAAWQFVESLPEEERFGLSVICPGMITGRPLLAEMFSTGHLIRMYLMSEFPGGRLPNLHLPCVDVQDCAVAHLRALESDSAQGQRFLLCERAYWQTEIGDILSAEFAESGYRIPNRVAPLCLIKMVVCFRPELSILVQQWGVEQVFNNERSRKVLDINYTDMQDSLIEMGHGMIDAGLVPDFRQMNK